MIDQDSGPTHAAAAAVVAPITDIRAEAGAGRDDPALRSLLRSDPLGSFLLLRCRLHFSMAGLFCLTLAFLLLLPLPIMFLRPGAVVPTPYAYMGTIGGFMLVVSWLVFLPAVWAYYAWQPVAIVRLHACLSASLAADPPAAGRARPPSHYGHIGWTLVALPLPILEFYRFMTAQTFHSAGPWIYQSTLTLKAAFVLLACVTYYMVALILVRQVAATVTVNRVFRHERVPVRHLHPDRCGGLGYLGEFALGVAPLILAAGLNLSLGWIRLIDGLSPDDPSKVASLVAVSVVYVVGSILAFVPPLWSAHKEMLDQRDAWLNDIAEGFERQQEVVRRQMRSGTPDDEAVTMLESARKAWEIGRRFPTWPLDVAAGRKFTAALLSPVLPIGVAGLQKFLHVE